MAWQGQRARILRKRNADIGPYEAINALQLNNSGDFPQDFRSDSSEWERMETTKPPLTIAWFIWGLGALFYMVGFFHRVAPAVMTEELMRDFSIGAAALGNLSAFYFYSYVAMQIPTGILADTWGPRRLLTAGAFVAGLGTLLFAFSQGIAAAAAGRLLIGASVAVAFVCMLKLASNWFPTRMFAMVTGAALFSGIIGAVSAGPPLRLLMDLSGWRTIMIALALFTWLIGLGIYLFVRDWPRQKGFENLIEPDSTSSSISFPLIYANIRQSLQSRNTILLFFIPGGIVGCTLTFSGLWGVPYLSTHHGLTTAEASAATSCLLVAWAIGGPVFGWASDRLGKRKPLYILGCAVCILGWSLLFFTNAIGGVLLVIVLMITGFCSGCMVVSFAFAKESVPARLAGTVSGIINMGVMMGPMILQPVVGIVLDALWQEEMLNGARIYSQNAYRAGFSLMLAWAAVSLALLLFTRETHCRQTRGGA